jgi:hypothetical protein
MQQNTQILRTKNGVRVLCVVIYLAGISLLWIHLPFGIPDRFRIWGVPCYFILGALWLADVFLTRIVLGSDSLRIVSVPSFQSRIIPRAEIDSVTWAKGCGASLILRDGKGVSLPSVGRNAQGLTNTIRAWLKKTEISL